MQVDPWSTSFQIWGIDAWFAFACHQVGPAWGSKPWDQFWHKNSNQIARGFLGISACNLCSTTCFFADRCASRHGSTGAHHLVDSSKATWRSEGCTARWAQIWIWRGLEAHGTSPVHRNCTQCCPKKQRRHPQPHSGQHLRTVLICYRCGRCRGQADHLKWKWGRPKDNQVSVCAMVLSTFVRSLPHMLPQK